MPILLPKMQSLLHEYENLIITRTLSKSYSLAGLAHWICYGVTQNYRTIGQGEGSLQC